ncbi:uncharacterized protein LOC106465053 isoform X2 [Limulus polyphemus]|uniref:Uncharacterized protein LOC106465053 isoform X2 n=1 Tax=Limulus polyphemus TaxID=6850 RepID=A0ABM1BF27_LIMPO|nr:uncharacterized protein LOC106465053 isoform X2 [Limulus polyphemus]
MKGQVVLLFLCLVSNLKHLHTEHRISTVKTVCFQEVQRILNTSPRISQNKILLKKRSPLPNSTDREINSKNQVRPNNFKDDLEDDFQNTFFAPSRFTLVIGLPQNDIAKDLEFTNLFDILKNIDSFDMMNNPVLKSGICPMPSVSTIFRSILQDCKDDCSFDEDCPGKQKCCVSDCGFKCLSPISILDSFATKPGTCPDSPRPQGDKNIWPCLVPHYQCYVDQECPGVSKCCVSACGSSCVDSPKSTIPSATSPKRIYMILKPPKCSPEGGYAVVQHQGTLSWCVDEMGKPLHHTLTIGIVLCDVDGNILKREEKQPVCPGSDHSPKVCTDECLSHQCPLHPNSVCVADPCNNCSTSFINQDDEEVNCEDSSQIVTPPIPVSTKCEVVRERHLQLGYPANSYIPHCDLNGQFLPQQCFTSEDGVENCWCVNEAGVRLGAEIFLKGTQTCETVILKKIKVVLGFSYNSSALSRSASEDIKRLVMRLLNDMDVEIEEDNVQVKISSSGVNVKFNLTGKNKVDAEFHLQEMIKNLSLEINGIKMSADLYISTFSHFLNSDATHENRILEHMLVNVQPNNDVQHLGSVVVLTVVAGGIGVLVLLLLVAVMIYKSSKRRYFPNFSKENLAFSSPTYGLLETNPQKKISVSDYLPFSKEIIISTVDGSVKSSFQKYEAPPPYNFPSQDTFTDQ